MSMYHEEEFENEKVKIQTWKKLLSFAKPHKNAIILMSMFMIFMAVTDVILPYMRAYAIDEYIIAKDTSGLTIFALVYLVILLFTCFNVYGFIYQAGRIEVNVSYDIRCSAFDKLQKLAFSYFDTTPVGYIMARMTADTTKLGRTIAWSLVDLVWGFFFMLAALIGMLLMNWKLALIMVATVPPIAVISGYFRIRILKYQRRVRKNNSKITGAFNEGIMGARTTKTLGCEEKNYNEFSETTTSMRDSSVKAATMSAIYMPIVMTVGAIATGILLWIGGEAALDKALLLGELNFFISMSSMFFEPIYQAARIFAELQSSQAAAERVMQLVETNSDIIDSEKVIAIYGDEINPKKENWPEIHGDIEFNNVSFKYNRGDQVLSNFSLRVNKGQTIALVGETGSGKSTIVNLICRFYEPTEGGIKIDSVDYKERSQIWLHSNLGYVLQSPHLFSGNIADNIRYGRLEATDEEVKRAAKLVDAHSFIDKLHDKYDTSVGEGGNRLSTGEKQLISFARAVLADPAIFVLDEATSSIDTETEAKIQNAIEKVLENRTSFVIAHRLSTIRHADRILVISDGKIIEDGNHNELMAAKGHYYKLYTKQFIHEAENTLLNIEQLQGGTA